MAFIVFAGQSNMGGYGTSAANLNSAWRPDPLTQIWDPDTRAWAQMAPGTNTGFSDAALAHTWGPEVNFAIQFRAAFPTEPLYIVKNVHGGSALANGWGPSSPLFQATREMVDAASRALGGARPEALMWGQGEADAENPGWAQTYHQNFTGFLAAARAQWLNGPQAPVFFFQINTATAYDAEVRAAQSAVDQADPRAFSFDSEPLPRQWPDELHFSPSGYDVIGAEFFRLYQAARGAAPGDPPQQAAGGDLNGTAAPDTLIGGAGDDRIGGGGGKDVLRGGEGSDLMSGGDEFDDMHGNQGADTLAGDAGDDWVVGGKDADRLYGGDGNDVVLGNIGDDLCDGGAGDDVIRGGQDSDQLFGWSGRDWLSGDRGSDTISGGSGADTFHFFADAGLDHVSDFNAGEGDRVQLLPGTAYTVAQVGGDTVITVAGGQMVLAGVWLGALPPGWIFEG